MFSLLRSIKIACRRQIPERDFKRNFPSIKANKDFFSSFLSLTSSRECVVTCYLSFFFLNNKTKLNFIVFMLQVESRIWVSERNNRKWRIIKKNRRNIVGYEKLKLSFFTKCAEAEEIGTNFISFSYF
jgi:hypothetical protein